MKVIVIYILLLVQSAGSRPIEGTGFVGYHNAYFSSRASCEKYAEVLQGYAWVQEQRLKTECLPLWPYPLESTE